MKLSVTYHEHLKCYGKLKLKLRQILCTDMSYFCRPGHLESCDSCWAGDGRACKVDGSYRAQVLVSPGLAMLLCMSVCKCEFMQAYMYACTYICVNIHTHVST